MSWYERAKKNYAGYKELRKYVLKSYKDLPFIIDLHDYPLYASHSGEKLEKKYEIMYPLFNTKLGKLLNEYKKTKRDVSVRHAEMQIFPGYHSAGIEFYPVRLNGNKFDVLSPENGKKFVTSLTKYLQKNNL